MQRYTQIKGGATGQIKSGDYVAPAVGESFAQSGSSYDLDNASITTENFYSNNTGAGIKGHIEADSGKIGQWQIDQSGSILSGGVDSYGAPAIFGLTTISPSVMLGYGVKPNPSYGDVFVSSYGAHLARVAIGLSAFGFSVFAGGTTNVPIGNPVPMTEIFSITHGGILRLNGYETAQNRAQNNGYLSFNGIKIAWGMFTANATVNQVITMPIAFTQAPRIALTLSTTSIVTTIFARVGSRTPTTFVCNSNTTQDVMYIAIGY